MADHPYLDDPSFKEPNKGPLITPHRPSDGRSPSRRQIKARCKAIRKAYPRKPVGEVAERWTPPEIAAPEGFDAVDKVA